MLSHCSRASWAKASWATRLLLSRVLEECSGTPRPTMDALPVSFLTPEAFVSVKNWVCPQSQRSVTVVETHKGLLSPITRSRRVAAAVIGSAAQRFQGQGFCDACSYPFSHGLQGPNTKSVSQVQTGGLTFPVRIFWPDFSPAQISGLTLLPRLSRQREENTEDSAQPGKQLINSLTGEESGAPYCTLLINGSVCVSL